jgi:hypothetical protein
VTGRRRVRFTEATGVTPLGLRWRQAMIALRGQPGVPPSRYDLSSLSQLRPRLGIPLWLGREVEPRTVLLTNLFNHDQTPIADGWSVKRTQVRDFRGRGLTYDSHNGTDFAIPVGTPVTTAAEGVVVRVDAEFNRGGLKVYIDHGGALMTCSAHLARALVAPGDRVRRGQVVALSGYSGLDGFATFPWGVPHVHFNVWLGGEPVDPFPHEGAASLWRAGDRPAPAPIDAPDEPFAPSVYDEAAVEAAIDACTIAEAREAIRAEVHADRRAAALVAARNYYPTRFSARAQVYAAVAPRDPRLDLPFSAARFDRVRLIDEPRRGPTGR